MREPANHRATRDALTPTPSTPTLILDDPASQDRAFGLKVLTHDFQSELIEAGKRGQIRTIEGNVRHVEVPQMVSVRDSIFEKPRPLPTDRHADHDQPTTTPSITKSLSGSSQTTV